MYAQHVGLNVSTVEMCNQMQAIPSTGRTACGPLATDNAKVGRLGVRMGAGDHELVDAPL
jgi:hypothetical protein